MKLTRIGLFIIALQLIMVLIFPNGVKSIGSLLPCIFGMILAIVGLIKMFIDIRQNKSYNDDTKERKKAELKFSFQLSFGIFATVFIIIAFMLKHLTFVSLTFVVLFCLCFFTLICYWLSLVNYKQLFISIGKFILKLIKFMYKIRVFVFFFCLFLSGLSLTALIVLEDNFHSLWRYSWYDGAYVLSIVFIALFGAGLLMGISLIICGLVETIRRKK